MTGGAGITGRAVKNSSRQAATRRASKTARRTALPPSIADVRAHLNNALEQQTATSDVLRIISKSPNRFSRFAIVNSPLIPMWGRHGDLGTSVLAHHADNMARVSGRRDYSLLNNIGLANDKVHALARLDAILKRKLMKMSKLTMLIVAAVLLTSHARAQVTVEVAKITCHQFLAFSVADPKDIAIWLSGYYHGKHGASNFEPQTFKANFDKLKSACYLKENYNLPVMQVIEKTLGTSK